MGTKLKQSGVEIQEAINKIIDTPTFTSIGDGLAIDLKTKALLSKPATDTDLGAIKIGADFELNENGQLSLYHPIDIKYFTNNHTLVALGEVIKSVKLTWGLNKIPQTITLDGKISLPLVRDGEYIIDNITINSDKSFKIEVDDGRNTKSATTTIAFANYCYSGSAANFKVSSMTASLSRSHLHNFEVNCGPNDFIFYAYPARFKTPTFYVGGFEGGFEYQSTEQLVNDHGYLEDYCVYKSNRNNLGQTTVEVR